VSNNTATVRAIYAAFGQGNIPAILSKLTDDVLWDTWLHPSPAQAVIPYLTPRKGKAEVGSYFAAIAGLEFHGFQPLNLLEGGNQVAAVINLDATVRATGHRFQDVEVHLWTFDAAGKIIEMRHMLDTGKQAAAHQP
jgi:uncharacterized protein